MAKDQIVIVDAARTAIGNFNGSLANIPAVELGSTVVKKLLERNKFDHNLITDVIIGHVITGGLGQNPARQTLIKSGISQESSAYTINQVCGSGLKAVALAASSIKAGDADIVIAGGQENMSLGMHAMHLRNPVKMGNAEMKDMMVFDGLTDVFNNYLMGITAENIAESFGISRDEQDKFALESQNKAEKAQKEGKFKDEIIDFVIKSKKEEKIFNQDEFIRAGATLESLAKLNPAFKKEGTVTAGNASGINDGAAMALVMKLSTAEKLGLKPMAKIVSYANAGVDPKIMGTGPVPASKKALAIAGWDVKDLDLIEANEAFAVQALYVNKNMGWDTSKVNVNGGAIAIGHPIGASGARVLTTLLYEMKRRSAKKGLATLCIGGGMGVAMCIEAI